MSGHEQNMDRGVGNGSPSRVTGYDAVRVLLAVVLLAGAVLKGHQLATEPVRGAGLFESRWFLIGLVELELCFGLWILTGRTARLTWRAAILCFGGFACVSAFKAISGEASCGCFGKVPVSPWYTLSLDVALVGLLLVFPPARATPGSKRVWGLPGWICAVVAIVVGVPGAFAMGTFLAGVASAEGGVQGQDGLVLLMPEEWKGERFPLFDQIDVGDRLTKGRWHVVLYHLGCPECQELIEQCQQVGIPGGEGPRRASVAFVEVPEPGQSGEKVSLDEDVCLMGRLSESREWFVSTPVLLTLQDGTVNEVCETGSAEVIFAMLTGSPPGS